MSTTLYRKYRPQAFFEVVGQKHVVQTLKNAIKSGRIGQAYLFAGPRGTGKTSIARILAKTINCSRLKSGEPCLKCESCQNIVDNRSLDIIEIDAASNTGVDNIRELRETVKLPPSALKYKAYIIDEVHMLSGGAFNALLKTLEEPPAHVVFILATTEVHKIPETILSRVQRFDFTRLTIEQIIKRLGEIAKLEKVKIEPGALEIIALHSEGGMRNAESLLGQIIALEDQNITAKEVEFILGTASEKEMVSFSGSLIEKDIAEVFLKIGALRESGVDFRNFGKSLLNYLRQILVIKINPDLGKKISYEMTKERLAEIKKHAQNIEMDDLIGLIESLQENMEKFKSSPIPHLFLEISAANFRLGSHVKTPKNEILDPKLAETAPKNKDQKENTKSEDSEIKNNPIKTKNNSSSSDLDLVISNWPEIIESLKSYNHSLSSVLKMCRPALIEGKYLILCTKYAFYNDKIAEAQNRLTIEKAIDKISGVNLRVKALTEKDFKKRYGDAKRDKSILQEAMEIFGGKVVKE